MLHLSVNITPSYVKIKIPRTSLASKISKTAQDVTCMFSLGILVSDDGAMRGKLKYEAKQISTKYRNIVVITDTLLTFVYLYDNLMSNLQYNSTTFILRFSLAF